MKKDNKKIYMVLIFILLLGIGCGYAVINSTLLINGRSNIEKNTWDIHFNNVVVKEGSVEAVKLPTIENLTTVDFEVALNLPGDFYEFTVDVVNNGTIDAMIESVEKTFNLSDEQSKYLNYVIEYQNDVQLLPNQLVKSGEFVRLKVRVEFKKDIQISDLPQNIETLNLGFKINYIQADGNKIGVRDNGVFKVKANGSLDEIGTIVTIGDQQFYVIGSDSENVKLFARYNLYVGYKCSMSPLTCIPYGDEATGMQHEEMLGNDYFDSNDFTNGTVMFSSEEQKGTNYSDYNGSIVEGYVNNYKNILENKYGIDIKEARIISKNELMSSEIGCNSSRCSDAPNWIRNSVFWLSDSYDSKRNYFLNSYTYGFNFAFAFYSDSHVAGVRPVLVMAKSDIEIDTTPNAIGDINEIGTIVTIGSEQFYTIGTDSENVKLLSKYNLYVGSFCTSANVSSCVAYGEEATGMQKYNMLGYIIYEPSKRNGATPFSSDEQKGETYSSYNGSIVEKYVNNYKNLLEQNLNLVVKEARLLSYEELTNKDNCQAGINCLDSFNWIYSTSYWLSTSPRTNELKTVSSTGGIGESSYNNSGSSGVRPVIVISKDYF